MMVPIDCDRLENVALLRIFAYKTDSFMKKRKEEM